MGTHAVTWLAVVVLMAVVVVDGYSFSDKHVYKIAVESSSQAEFEEQVRSFHVSRLEQAMNSLSECESSLRSIANLTTAPATAATRPGTVPHRELLEKLNVIKRRLYAEVTEPLNDLLSQYNRAHQLCDLFADLQRRKDAHQGNYIQALIGGVVRTLLQWTNYSPSPSELASGLRMHVTRWQEWADTDWWISAFHFELWNMNKATRSARDKAQHTYSAIQEAEKNVRTKPPRPNTRPNAIPTTTKSEL